MLRISELMWVCMSYNVTTKATEECPLSYGLAQPRSALSLGLQVVRSSVQTVQDLVQ